MTDVALHDYKSTIGGRRVAWPVDKWPPADRLAWVQAQQSGSFMDDDGRAAGWRPATRKAAVGVYGRLLAYLNDHQLLDAGLGPADRVTPETIGGYIVHLRLTVSSTTVATYIGQLEMMIHATAPGQDWAWLRRLQARQQQRATPIRNKRSKIVPQTDLLQLGLDLMEKAEKLPSHTPLQAALAYRDGLMIALLATTPLRQRNFVGIEIGRHLVWTGAGYMLCLGGDETKNHRPDERPFPEALLVNLQRYLTHHRACLAGLRTSRGKSRQSSLPAASGRLWVTQYGTPFSASAQRKALEKHTTARFGHAVNAHLFRDCAATEIAYKRPEQIRIAASVLGHASFRTTEQYYILANEQAAFAAHHDMLESIWSEGEKPRRRSRPAMREDSR